jgi:hypothetical protein
LRAVSEKTSWRCGPRVISSIGMGERHQLWEQVSDRVHRRVIHHLREAFVCDDGAWRRVADAVNDIYLI